MARPKKTPESEPETPTEPINMLGWEEWPQIEEAAEELGVAARTLLRRVKKGEFPRYRCPDGIYRYNPEDLEDAGSIPETPEKSVQHSTAQLLEQSTRMLMQAHTHIEKLMTLVSGPASLIMGHLEKHAERSDKRVVELEAKVIGMVDAQQEILNEQAERDVMKQIALAAEARKDQAVGILKDQFGPLIGQYLSKLTGTDKKAALFQKFAGSLDPDLIAVLLHPENDTLNAEQKALLAALLAKE